MFPIPDFFKLKLMVSFYCFDETLHAGETNEWPVPYNTDKGLSQSFKNQPDIPSWMYYRQALLGNN